MNDFDKVFSDDMTDDMEFDTIFGGEEDGELIDTVGSENFFTESGEEADFGDEPDEDVDDEPVDEEEEEKEVDPNAPEVPKGKPQVNTSEDLDNMINYSNDEEDNDEDDDYDDDHNYGSVVAPPVQAPAPEYSHPHHGHGPNCHCPECERIINEKPYCKESEIDSPDDTEEIDSAMQKSGHATPQDIRDLEDNDENNANEINRPLATVKEAQTTSELEDIINMTNDEDIEPDSEGALDDGDDIDSIAESFIDFI